MELCFSSGLFHYRGFINQMLIKENQHQTAAGGFPLQCVQQNPTTPWPLLVIIFVSGCSEMIGLQRTFLLASPSSVTKWSPFLLSRARRVTQVLISRSLSSGLAHESIAKSALGWQIECIPLSPLTRFLKTAFSCHLFTISAFHWYCLVKCIFGWTTTPFSLLPSPLPA